MIDFHCSKLSKFSPSKNEIKENWSSPSKFSLFPSYSFFNNSPKIMDLSKLASVKAEPCKP